MTLTLIEDAKEKYNVDDVDPIVVLSYKRGDNASTLKLLRDSNLNVYLCIYDSDRENYKETLSCDNVTLLICPDEFNTIEKKRNFALESIHNLGYHGVYMLDDDIRELFRAIPGNNRTSRQTLTADDFFTVWHYIMTDKTDYKPFMTGIGSWAFVFSRPFDKIEYSYQFGSTAQMFHLDIDALYENNMKFDESGLFEDSDLLMTGISKGLKPSYTWAIVFSAGETDTEKSMCTSSEYGWAKRTLRTIQKWGKYQKVRLLNPNALITASPNMPLIKKEFKNFGCIKNNYPYDEFEKYFNLPKTEDNPYGLDVEGFIEHWKPDIERFFRIKEEKNALKASRKNK